VKLSIDYEPDSVLNLVCDAEGANFLLKSIEKLRNGGHDHLMTEERGGWELTAPEVAAPAIPIHQWHIFVEVASDPKKARDVDGGS
jgi:hypothetical protein